MKKGKASLNSGKIPRMLKGVGYTANQGPTKVGGNTKGTTNSKFGKRK